MEAVKTAALQNADLLNMMKRHISMGLSEDGSRDRSAETQIRLAEIDVEFKELLGKIGSDESIENYDDSAIRRLADGRKTQTRSRILRYC